MSVFATPSGGNHRIDKFQGSLSVSSVIAKTVNPDQMEALIKEHKFRIEKIVDELIVKLQAAGKDTSVITVDTYKELLRTGKLPSTWTTIGLKLDKLPVFFEARAMAAGNICMNKTEGIGYPTFSSLVDDKGKTHMITRITTTKEVDYVG